MSLSSLGALPLLAASATPGARSAADSLSQPDMRLPIALGALIAAALAWQIASYFLVSKLLAPEKSEFSNAVKLWALSICAAVGVVIVAGCGVAAGSWLDSRIVSIGALVAGGLMLIYVAFRIPMEIYGIGVLRTIAFYLLAAVIHGIGQFTGAIIIRGMPADTPLAVANRTIIGQQPGDQDELFAFLRTRFPALAPRLDAADAATAANRTKPAPERKAALRRTARVLEARRVALDPKDKAAVAEYKRDAKRYSELFHEVNPPPPKP